MRAEVDWEQKAWDVVGYLRMDAGRHPDDLQLSALVGELSVKSPEFRWLWAAHDVKAKGNGTKSMRHPPAGDLTCPSRPSSWPMTATRP